MQLGKRGKERCQVSYTKWKRWVFSYLIGCSETSEHPLVIIFWESLQHQVCEPYFSSLCQKRPVQVYFLVSGTIQASQIQSSPIPQQSAFFCYLEISEIVILFPTVLGKKTQTIAAICNMISILHQWYCRMSKGMPSPGKDTKMRQPATYHHQVCSGERLSTFCFKICICTLIFTWQVFS